MTDLTCNYLGLKLKNPVIVGSSGLTSSLENLKTVDSLGAGAVVLKSIFEEQIKFESEKFLHSGDRDMQMWNQAFEGIVSRKEHYYDEAYNYITNYAKEHSLDHYLKLIRDAKRSISIPVIASINCNTQYDWEYFARKIQEAGADALELNIYLLPSDFARKGEDNEKVYFDIVREVLKNVSIPVSLKIGYYFSSLANTAYRLSESGIAGLTLFNRPYNPDIDTDNLQSSASNMFSNPNEYAHTLRWIALLSGKLKCSLAASSGIHDHATAIKQLLAGADAVQMVSVFYRNGFSVLPGIIKGIGDWMESHGFKTIEDFRGKLNSSNVENAAVYERVQFIRLFSGIE